MLVSETMAMKVMVAGDVEGSLTALFKRVEAVDKKAGKCVFPPGPVLKSVFLPCSSSKTRLAGPFEMLLCVGSFFGPGNPGWSDYKSGR